MAYYKYDPRSKYIKERKTAENREAYADAVKREYKTLQSLSKESVKDEIAGVKSKGFYSYLYRNNDDNSEYDHSPKSKNNSEVSRKNKTTKTVRKFSDKVKGLCVGRMIRTKEGQIGRVTKYDDTYVYITLDGKAYRGKLQWIGKSIFLE